MTLNPLAWTSQTPFMTRNRPLRVNDGGLFRLAVCAGGQPAGGPNAGSPTKLLIDFGQTHKGQTGWNTLEHP
jgi:hypothetical protein